MDSFLSRFDVEDFKTGVTGREEGCLRFAASAPEGLGTLT